MATEVEELLVLIRAKAQGFDNATKKMASGMQAVGNAVQTAQKIVDQSSQAARKSLGGIGNQAQAVASVIQRSYSGAPVGSLVKQFAALEQKIIKQKALVESLYQSLDQASAAHDEMMRETGFANEIAPTKEMTEFESAARKARQELNAMNQESKAIAANIVNAAQSQNVQAEQKQSTAAAKAGIDNIAFAMQSLAFASNGVLSELTSMATQVRFLKKGYQEMAETGNKSMAAFTTGLAGAMIALNMVMSLVSHINKQRKEAVETAKANAESFAVNNTEITDAQRYISVLQNRKATTEQVTEATSGLASLFPDMIQGYDAEGNAILGTVGQMKEYLRTQEMINQAKIEELASEAPALFDSMTEDIENLESVYARYMGLVNSGIDPGEQLETALEEGQVKSLEAIESYKTGLIAQMQEVFGVEVAAELKAPIQKMCNDMYEEIDTAMKNGATPASVKGIIEKYSDQFNSMQGNMRSFKNAANKLGKNLSKNLDVAIKSALMNTEKSIDNSEMEKIVQRATEIDDKSVNKDTEKALKGFREMMVTELSMQDIDTGEAARIVDDIVTLFGDGSEFQSALASGDPNALSTYINTVLENAKTTASVQGQAALSVIQDVADSLVARWGILQSFGVDVPKFKTGGGGRKRSGGGGGTKKNTALENELKLLEHRRALNQLTYQEEIAQLERIYRKYAKTTEEKWDLEEQLYDARMAMREEALEYDRAMDRLTLREEIDRTWALIGQYAAGTEKRRELETEVYDLQKQLQRQEYDLNVYYGRLTLAQQEAQLRQMIGGYKAGTEARIELEKELYDVQQQIRQQNIDTVDSMMTALTQALQTRYEEQQQAETDRINDSIDSWRNWAEEQTKAIQAQIDALDEQKEQEDKAEQERQKRRKIAALTQQLQYEQDAYNRKKLAEQLAKAQQELDDWLRKNEIEAQKKALQAELQAAQDKADAEQKALEEQLETNDKAYEERLKQQNLEAEAQRILMQNSQGEILDLLKSYASDYNLTGQTLGEQLVDGFQKQVGNIENWFKSMTSRLTEYQRQMAEVATQSADAFYAAHGMTGPPQQAAVTPAQPPQITVNFNQPVESPTAVRRAMEDALEKFYQMM